MNRGNGSLIARSRKLVSSIYSEGGFSLSSTWTIVVVGQLVERKEVPYGY